MMTTSFWQPDGRPMSAQQFLEALFGKLPEFFKDEEELRALWSARGVPGRCGDPGGCVCFARDGEDR